MTAKIESSAEDGGLETSLSQMILRADIEKERSWQTAILWC